MAQWFMTAKPVPAGLDDWSHWEHGPDNNPVSDDEIIKAPYMTQWLGTPYYIAMPAISTAAGGRLFIAMGHIDDLGFAVSAASGCFQMGE